MDIRTFLRSTAPAERERVARSAGTTVAYLYVIASGHRKPSPRLCAKLVEADSRLSKNDLRPDIYGEAA